MAHVRHSGNFKTTEMKILYCIILNPNEVLTADMNAVSGLEGQPLEQVSAVGLSAVTSNLNGEKPPTDIKALLAYQKVIDFFFARQTLIPMRFGTTVSNSQQLVGHLGDKAVYYKNLLAEIEDCVEIGVRITSCQSRSAAVMGDTIVEPEKTGGKPSGRAFLEARKAYFADQEQISAAAKGAVNNLKNFLSGLYVKIRVESRRPNFAGITPGESHENMVAINFLVRREHLQHFKDIFRQADANQPETFTLSGPWPPYNFVVDESERVAAELKK